MIHSGSFSSLALGMAAMSISMQLHGIAGDMWFALALVFTGVAIIETGLEIVKYIKAYTPCSRTGMRISTKRVGNITRITVKRVR